MKIKQKDSLIYSIVLCVVMVNMLVMNFMLGYITDDWHFKFAFQDFVPTGNDVRVTSISGLVESMASYYKYSGGRVFAHSIMQMFLIFDKWVFNVVNSLVFVLVGKLITDICCQQKKKNYKILVLTYISMYVFLPSFGDSCIWLSGSVNYLWMSVFPLVFIKQLLMCNDVKSDSWRLVLLAFLSGITNEATGGMLIVFLVARRILLGEKISKQRACCMLVMALGAASIVLAPGNWNRAKLIDDTSIFSIQETIVKFFETVFWYLENGYYIFVFPVVCLFFIKHEKTIVYEWLSYFITAIAGVGALALSGTFIKRAQFICVVFIIIGSISVVYYLLNNHKVIDNARISQISKRITKETIMFLKKIGLIVGVCFIVVYFSMNYSLYNKACKAERMQVDMIEKAAASGNDISIEPLIHYNPGGFYPNEGSCSKEYQAQWQGLYYGINIHCEER